MFGFRHLMRSIGWEQKPHLWLTHNVRLTEKFKSWSDFETAQKWYNFHLDYCQWTSSHDWLHPERISTPDCRNVVLIRDPRDIINTFYWYSWKDYNFDPNHLLNIIRGLMNSTRIDFTNLWPSAKELCQMQLWAQQSSNCIPIYFEDMHKSDLDALKKLMGDLGLYPHPFGMSEEDFQRAVFLGSFKHQTAGTRQRGKENSGKQLKFISSCRKGTVGDWRSSFTPEACDLFKELAGEELIQLGYENSLDWSV